VGDVSMIVVGDRDRGIRRRLHDDDGFGAQGRVFLLFDDAKRR
jgi:hypothetical protein